MDIFYRVTQYCVANVSQIADISLIAQADSAIRISLRFNMLTLHAANEVAMKQPKPCSFL